MHSEKNIGEVHETIENRKASLEEKSGYMNLDLTNTTSDILEYSFSSIQGKSRIWQTLSPGTVVEMLPCNPFWCVLREFFHGGCRENKMINPLSLWFPIWSI